MSMRAIQVKEFGDEKKVKLCDNVPIPKPADDEVLVKVKAAGINPIDVIISLGVFPGHQMPVTIGCEAAGIVEEVGASVKGFKKGDRVLGFNTQGTFAEYCTLKAARTCPLHESLNFEQGASIGIAYYSAHLAAFNKGDAKAGDVVLVHGASGGVGIAAVQILKAHGCYVIGTAGTPEGLKIVLELGADKVYNHREKDYMSKLREELPTGKGVNIIIDMLANVNLQADLELIADKGKIVVMGSRGAIEITPIILIMKDASVHGIYLFVSTDEEMRPMHEAMEEGQSKGWLKPKVAKVYKMEDFAQAHRDIMSNSGTLGKLVLDVAL